MHARQMAIGLLTCLIVISPHSNNVETTLSNATRSKIASTLLLVWTGFNKTESVCTNLG